MTTRITLTIATVRVIMTFPSLTVHSMILSRGLDASFCCLIALGDCLSGVAGIDFSNILGFNQNIGGKRYQQLI